MKDDIEVNEVSAICSIAVAGLRTIQTSSTKDPGNYLQFQAMQNHLCQILAHYIVYIGSKLSLPIASHTEKFIIEAATSRWHKEGVFLWSTPSGHDARLEALLEIDNSSHDCNGRSNFCFDKVNDNTITLIKSHEPSSLDSIYDLTQDQNLPDLTDLQSALLWEVGFTQHQQGSKLLIVRLRQPDLRSLQVPLRLLVRRSDLQIVQRPANKSPSRTA